MPKKKTKPKVESHLEASFLQQWLLLYPHHKPTLQHQFHSVIKWRFDFSWPSVKVAVEVHGMGPGHFSLPGMTRDFNKGRAALILNWRVVYLTSNHLLPENFRPVARDIARLIGIPPNITQSKTGYVPINKRK